MKICVKGNFKFPMENFKIGIIRKHSFQSTVTSIIYLQLIVAESIGDVPYLSHVYVQLYWFNFKKNT